MQQFTIHAAKTNLSKLIEAALRGEERAGLGNSDSGIGGFSA